MTQEKDDEYRLQLKTDLFCWIKRWVILYLSGVMSERMVMAAFSLCLTSR